MNFDALTTERRWDGADEDRRQYFSLNAFAERERGTFLDALFYYWSAKCDTDGAPPRTDAFRPTELFAESLLRDYHGVDVCPTDPANFVIEDHPGGAMKGLHGGMSGKRISQFPARLQVDACMAEYEACRRLGIPMYHEIDQILLGYVRRYRRLMLPLVDHRGTVVRIAYGVRYLEPPIRLF